MPQRDQLKVSTRVMYDELCRQNIPVRIIDASSSLLEFTDISGTPRLLFSTSSDKSSAVGQNIAKNKVRTEAVARELNIPTPIDIVCTSFEEVLTFFNQHKCIVLKPLSNSGGSGVSTNITSLESLSIAYDYAAEYGNRVIAQQHIMGSDIRLLVIAGTFASAVERRPAHVTGDGVFSLRSLLERENNSGHRSADAMSAMDLIDCASAERYLGDRMNYIPLLDEKVTVVGPANLSLGGTAHEATHLVSSEMIAHAEKITRKLNLAICGVDMIWNQTTGAYSLIEVNATPGVNMHNDPLWGTSSTAIEKYVSWLFTSAIA